MITYIIKTAACSLLLWLVYRLLLQREKMYAFNRAYLLFSMAFSMLVPLFSMEIAVDLPVIPETTFLPAILQGDSQPTALAPLLTPAHAPSGWSWAIISIVLYWGISLCLLCRFVWNLYRIRKTALSQQSSYYQGARLILVDNNIPAHSFLACIFMSKADYSDSDTRETLLTHELSHVRLKHSWDILFIESIRIVYWIIPTFYFYKKAVQLNHELQADETVIRTHGNISGYQHLLLDKMEQHTITPLTSSFNYLITKKRLAMMTKQPNNKRIACLQWALLPLFVLAAFLFTGRTYAQVQPSVKKPATPGYITKTWGAKDSTRISFKAGQDIPPGNGATPEQLAQFNTIFKSTGTDNKGRLYSFTAEDVKWIKPIYQAMTKEQRSQYPDLYFMRPPARKSPTAANLQAWTNAAQYGVWIDGKRIDNQELANYKPEDFALYFTSRLSKNAKNYGKHYVQVDLSTNGWYNKTYRADTDLLMVVEKVSPDRKKTN